MTCQVISRSRLSSLGTACTHALLLPSSVNSSSLDSLFYFFVSHDIKLLWPMSPIQPLRPSPLSGRESREHPHHQPQGHPTLLQLPQSITASQQLNKRLHGFRSTQILYRIRVL